MKVANKLLRCAAVGAVAISSAAWADVLPAGGKIDKALTADLTPSGIDFLLDQGLTLLPDQMDVPSMSGSQSCLFSDVDYSVYPGPDAANNGVSIDITSATVTPQQGYFTLSMNATVTGTGTDVDGEGDTHNFVVSRVEYSGCGTSCNQANGNWAVLRLNATPIAVTTELDLQLTFDPVTGDPIIDASTPLSREDIALNMNGLDAAGCNSIDILVALLKGFVGDFVKDEIIKMVNEELLPAVETGFQDLRFDDEIALGSSSLHVKLLPSAFDINPDGVAVSMSSVIEATQPTTCVPVEPGAGSYFTPGSYPDYSTVSPSGFAFDAAASISDDLVNQAMFAAWHGGLLCQTLGEMGGEPLSIDMLALAGLGGPLNKLGVQDGAPMMIVIKGYEPPIGSFGGDSEITLGVKNLEISIFTVVQERMARIVALNLQADAGIDLDIDAANVLTIALDLAPEDLLGTVTYSEPIGEEAAAGLIELLPVIMEQMLPSLADSLPSIDLGTLAGVTLVNPEFIAEQGAGGVPNDTLSAYTGLAPGAGCGATGGGCGVTGGGGCNVGARGQLGSAGLLLALALTPIATVLLRRRRG